MKVTRVLATLEAHEADLGLWRLREMGKVGG